MVSRKEVDDAYTELLKWIGTDDPKVGIFEFTFSPKNEQEYHEFLLPRISFNCSAWSPEHSSHSIVFVMPRQND